MVSCPGCGAGMRFDPESQKLKCDHCGTTALAEEVSQIQYVGQQAVFDSTLYTCPQCGAELVSDDATAATFCSFCGASVLLEQKAVRMAAPSYVIPFQVTEESCMQLYNKTIKRALFAPNYMREKQQSGKLRGIYMPYWNYDFLQNGPAQIEIKKTHRSGNYDITDYYSVTMDIHADYQGLSYDASSTFSDELSEAIAPYNIRECKTFSPAYLSGFYADTADVQAEVYEAEARNMAAADMFQEVSKRPEIRGAVIENDAGLKNALQKTGSQVSYFPVWFLASRKKDRVSYAVINGQTGKVAADIPIDYGKYLIGSILLAIPLILLLNFFFTLKPFVILLAAVGFAFISHIISNHQMNLLYNREHYLNDSGLQSVKGMDWEVTSDNFGKEPKKKTPMSKSSVLTLTLLALFGGVMIIIPLMAMTGSGDGALFGVFTTFMLFFISTVTMLASSNGKGKVIRQAYQYVCPVRKKIGVLIKPLIAEILGVILLVVNPYQDIIYYIGILVIMILVLFCFWDLVKIHNRLTMRLPRQFGKRGGDENEAI